MDVKKRERASSSLNANLYYSFGLRCQWLSRWHLFIIKSESALLKNYKKNRIHYYVYFYGKDMIPAILPLYERANIIFTHGQGAYLFADSKKYLDFAAGYAALALGHSHPRMIDALTNQAQKLWHLSNRYLIPGMEEYSQRLVDMSFADTVFLANAGAEAVECMIKMTRRYFNEKGETHRYRIITLDGAFHGRTLATASAGAKEKIQGFEPAVDGFDRVAWDDLVAIQNAISSTTAGILLEPVQGEGGMRAQGREYMKEVRNLCDRYGLLLLVDEVQSGMCRTGHMFAYEMYGIKPDLMALGKGLGAGFPISACLATEEVGKAMKRNSHGSTFGGNPLAIAVGTTVLDIMQEKAFLPHVKAIAHYLQDKLNQLRLDHADKIEEITGVGLMLGIKLKPHLDAEQFTVLCREELLLSIPAGQNTMRITPPFIIEEKQCDEAIEKFDRALKKMSSTAFKIKNAIKKIKIFPNR